MSDTPTIRIRGNGTPENKSNSRQRVVVDMAALTKGFINTNGATVLAAQETTTTPATTPALPGAQPGNRNNSTPRIVRQALMNALKTRSISERFNALEKIGEKLIEMAMGGDTAAMKELFDRLEGKAAQAIMGEEGGPPIGFEDQTPLSHESRATRLLQILVLAAANGKGPATPAALLGVSKRIEEKKGKKK